MTPRWAERRADATALSLNRTRETYSAVIMPARAHWLGTRYVKLSCSLCVSRYSGKLLPTARMPIPGNKSPTSDSYSPLLRVVGFQGDDAEVLHLSEQTQERA